MPKPGDHGREPPLRRWARRSLTLPLLAAGTGLALLGLPLWLLVALLIDLFRSARLATTRLVLMLVALLTWEGVGLLLSAGLWLRAPCGGAASRQRHRRLQTAWAGGLFGVARRLYGLEVIVEGQVPTSAPLLVLLRHTSLADTTLPAVLLQAPLGLRLRYVLKRELLWDPCLDVVGQRLPNLFLDRRRGDLDDFGRLAKHLTPGEGVVIYPEGTRFSPDRLARAQALLLERDPDRLARLGPVRHVLPPRPAGTLALLAACPDADILIVRHTGLEAARTLKSLWSGGLIGARVRVDLRWIPARDVPRDRDAALRWLDAEWAAIDAWVEAGPTARLGRAVVGQACGCAQRDGD